MKRWDVFGEKLFRPDGEMLFPALCAGLFFVLCYEPLFLPHRVLHVVFEMSTEAASADLIKKRGNLGKNGARRFEKWRWAVCCCKNDVAITGELNPLWCLDSVWTWTAVCFCLLRQKRPLNTQTGDECALSGPSAAWREGWTNNHWSAQRKHTWKTRRETAQTSFPRSCCIFMFCTTFVLLLSVQAGKQTLSL